MRQSLLTADGAESNLYGTSNVAICLSPPEATALSSCLLVEQQQETVSVDIIKLVLEYTPREPIEDYNVHQAAQTQMDNMEVARRFIGVIKISGQAFNVGNELWSAETLQIGREFGFLPTFRKPSYSEILSSILCLGLYFSPLIAGIILWKTEESDIGSSLTRNAIGLWIMTFLFYVPFIDWTHNKYNLKPNWPKFLRGILSFGMACLPLLTIGVINEIGNSEDNILDNKAAIVAPFVFSYALSFIGQINDNTRETAPYFCIPVEIACVLASVWLLIAERKEEAFYAFHAGFVYGLFSYAFQTIDRLRRDQWGQVKEQEEKWESDTCPKIFLKKLRIAI